MDKIQPMILMVCTGSTSVNFDKNDFTFIRGVVSYGPLLSPAQVKMLKISGSTLIPKEMYDNIPQKELKAEIERLAGVQVKIEKDVNTGSILVKNKKIKNKP